MRQHEGKRLLLSVMFGSYQPHLVVALAESFSTFHTGTYTSSSWLIVSSIPRSTSSVKPAAVLTRSWSKTSEQRTRLSYEPLLPVAPAKRMVMNDRHYNSCVLCIKLIEVSHHRVRNFSIIMVNRAKGLGGQTEVRTFSRPDPIPPSRTMRSLD